MEGKAALLSFVKALCRQISVLQVFLVSLAMESSLVFPAVKFPVSLEHIYKDIVANTHTQEGGKKRNPH